MKKTAFVLTTLAALTAAPVALAQERSDAPTTKEHGPSQHVQPPTAQQQAPMGQDAPVAPPPPVSMTIITSGDVTAVPMPPVHRETDSVTLNQSFRPHRPLLYSGGLMFLSAYGATMALNATGMLGNDRSMYIPVAGPWLHLMDISESPLDTALIIGSGVFQGAGVALAAASFIVPEKVPAVTVQAGGVKMTVTATSMGKGSAGIGAVGQF